MNERQLGPLARESTASIIADRLRTGIMEGLFAPGEQMIEARLASQLDVSRGLLREATQRLVQEGLLRSERYRGLFVVDLDTDDVWDIYLAREAVERAAVRALLRKGDQSLLDPLAKVVRRMGSAARSKRAGFLSGLDMQFHAQLVDASGSPRLKRAMQSLLVETRMCLRDLERHYRDPEELVTEHEDILAALSERDEPRVLELVSAHMADAIARLDPTTPVREQVHAEQVHEALEPGA